MISQWTLSHCVPAEETAHVWPMIYDWMMSVIPSVAWACSFLEALSYSRVTLDYNAVQCLNTGQIRRYARYPCLLETSTIYVCMCTYIYKKFQVDIYIYI